MCTDGHQRHHRTARQSRCQAQRTEPQRQHVLCHAQTRLSDKAILPPEQRLHDAPGGETL